MFHVFPCLRRSPIGLFPNDNLYPHLHWINNVSVGMFCDGVALFSRNLWSQKVMNLKLSRSLSWVSQVFPVGFLRVLWFPSMSHKHTVGVLNTVISPRSECVMWCHLVWPLHHHNPNQDNVVSEDKQIICYLGFLSCWKQLQIWHHSVGRERERDLICMFSTVPVQRFGFGDALSWSHAVRSRWCWGQHFAPPNLITLEEFCQSATLKLVIVTESNWCLL